MNWTKIYFLVVSTIFATITAYSQRGLVRYTREAGLNANSILDVTYDNKGFIWLASSKGIDRFDGQRAIHFSHEQIDSNTIASNDIRTIQCSELGMIWATTLNQGIIRINSENFKITNYNINSVRNFGSNYVKQLMLVGENMWLVFDDKLQYFLPNFGRLNTYILPKLDFDENFVQLLLDKDNPKLLWFITNKRIFEFNYMSVDWKAYSLTELNQTQAYDLEKKPIRMNRVLNDAKGNFCIGLENGDLVFFDKFQQVYRVVENPFEDLKGIAISDMDWRDSRYIYLCLNHKEILLFDTRLNQFIRYDENERGALFPVRLTSHNNQLAIASEIGLFLHDDSLIFGKKVHFKYRVLSMQRKNKKTYKLIEDLDGYFILGPDMKKVPIAHVLNPFQLHFYQNEFYIVAENGILVHDQNFREKRWIPFTSAKNPSNKLVSQLLTPTKKLFVASSEGGIYEVNTQKIKPVFVARTAVKRILVEEGIYPAFTFVNDKLIFSIGSDLYAIVPGVGRPQKQFHMSDYVTSLLYTQDKQLWVGTVAEGIHVMDYTTGRILRKINAYMGMQDDEVRSMVEDNLGRIWVLNKRCVAVLNTKNWSIQSLEPRNGMGQVTKIRVLDDDIYFFDQNGYIQVKSMTKFPKLIYPKPYIMRVRDINTGELVQEGRHLRFNQNNLAFEFGVLDFSNGTNNLVSYRLLGLDNQWQGGNQKDIATYFNLPNGKFQFQIKVIEDGRIYMETFDVIIEKPFYTTWWFIVLIILVVFVSIGLFLRTRINRIKSTEKMRTEFNLQINELESRALRAQMNPHFLFNSLNSIRLFILKNEVDSAADYIAKFSKLLRLILNHSRQDSITVYDEIQSLKLYLEFERLRFDKEFDFDLQIDGQEVLDCQIPPMIIQPFIENAIWHGLMPREDGKGLIRVSFLKQQSGLYVTVQDNGIGREKAKENNRKRSLKEGSVGLEITKDRLKWLTLRTNRQNEFEIEDLVDENGESIGTLVTLYFETPNKL